MKLSPITPAKSLSKAYLRQSLKRDQIELFKTDLARLFDRIRADEHEEHLKNIVADFLKDTWYKPAFEINTSKRADLRAGYGKNTRELLERVQKILAAPDSPDVPQLEAEIDRLVYDLYSLTEEEIALVEGKQ